MKEICYIMIVLALLNILCFLLGGLNQFSAVSGWVVVVLAYASILRMVR